MWSSVWRVQCRACGARVWRALSTSGASMDKALQRLETNPYYDKYAARIQQLQRSAPDEFERRAQAVVPPARRKEEPVQPEGDVGRYAAVLRPKESLAAPPAVRPRRLDAIFKTELVADSDAEQIAAIWAQYHLSQEVVAAVVPVDAHSRAAERAGLHPTFVVPLPRQHGYEFFLLQATAAAHTVHFTPLLAYQVHAENAPECLTLTHYTELSDKGIVLMRGEYDKSVLSPTEARCLANQFQLYYAGCEAERLRLLQTFTSRPDTFQHMELVRQLETISLEPVPAADTAQPTGDNTKA